MAYRYLSHAPMASLSSRCLWHEAPAPLRCSIQILLYMSIAVFHVEKFPREIITVVILFWQISQHQEPLSNCQVYGDLSPWEGPRYGHSFEHRCQGHFSPSPFTLPPRLVPTTLLPPHLPLMLASQFPGSVRTTHPIDTCFNIGWRMGEAFSFLLVGKKNISVPTSHSYTLKERRINCL